MARSEYIKVEDNKVLWFAFIVGDEIPIDICLSLSHTLSMIQGSVYKKNSSIEESKEFVYNRCYIILQCSLKHYFSWCIVDCEMTNSFQP